MKSGFIIEKTKSIFNTDTHHFKRVFWLLFSLSMAFKCLYFQYIVQLNTGPLYSISNLPMILCNTGMLLIITSLIVLITNRKRYAALLAADVIITLLLMGDINYFRYFYRPLSLVLLYNFNAEFSFATRQSIFTLFKPSDLVMMMEVPLMIAVLILLHKKGINRIPFARKALIAGILLFVGLSSVTLIRMNYETDTAPINSNYTAKKMGIIYSHYDDSVAFIKENNTDYETLSSKERKQINDFYKKKASENTSKYKQFSGLCKDKNLIIIQVEALQQFVINKRVEGDEITPNINKLIKESMYFNNFYYQVAAGNTSDAEFLCNTSLYPTREGSVYHRYASNKYNSLPKIMNNAGYNTYALHAFNPEFWNRAEMYKNLDFKRFVCREDFNLDDFAGWDTDALSDSSFFRQSMEKIDTSRPFYSFFVTLSSHHPFSFFEDYDFNVGKFQGSYIGNYLKAIHYADSCIGQFLEDLKKRGLYDNSLLLIYGDHSAVPKYLSDELVSFLNVDAGNNELEWTKLQKVPLIIHYPGFKTGETISVTGGQIDILPTVANLMGVEAPNALGKDLLNTEDGYVVLRNGSIITDKYFYCSDSLITYDLKKGKPVSNKSLEKELGAYLEELRISDLIIEKDAFRK